jgi:hypothetical protein
VTAFLIYRDLTLFMLAANLVNCIDEREGALETVEIIAG